MSDPDVARAQFAYDPARARAAAFPARVADARRLLTPKRELAAIHAARVGGKADDDAEVILAAEGETFSYKGVEIARIGTFDCMTGKCRFTREDFDDAVEAWESLKGKFDAPIKLGHNDAQAATAADGLPSAGWLANLRRVGDRLVADFIGVPEGVARLIENGTLRKRSIEAIKNVTIAGKKWPFVVTGIALLGAELPAVDSLKDIVEVFGASGLTAETADDAEVMLAAAALVAGAASSEAVSAEDRAAAEQDVFDLLMQLEDKASPLIKNRRGAPLSRSLFSAFRNQLREAISGRTAGGQMKGSQMDPKALRQALGLPEDATDDQVSAAIGVARTLLGITEDVDDAGVAAAAKSARETRSSGSGGGAPASDDTKASLAEVRRDLAAAQREISELRGARQSDEITSMVDEAIKANKVLPASRDALVKMGVNSQEDLKVYLAGLQPLAILATSARGLDGDADLAAYEPTADELSVAAALGRTREDVMRDKIAADGLEIPEKLRGKKAGA